MEYRRHVSRLTQLGSHWLMVTDFNPNVLAQRFIKQDQSVAKETITSLWNAKWSVQIAPYDKDTWIVVSTQWKTPVATQACRVDSGDGINSLVDSSWDKNQRITDITYHRGTWIVMNESIDEVPTGSHESQGKHNQLISQQMIRVSHWPTQEIQLIWAQGKRIQCVVAGDQDYIIIAEKYSAPVLPQIVQAGVDPSKFDFHAQLSNGKKLICATYQESSKLYTFVWDQVSEKPTTQDIYFATDFPEKKLATLGYAVEATNQI